MGSMGWGPMGSLGMGSMGSHGIMERRQLIFGSNFKETSIFGGTGTYQLCRFLSERKEYPLGTLLV